MGSKFLVTISAPFKNAIGCCKFIIIGKRCECKKLSKKTLHSVS